MTQRLLVPLALALGVCFAPHAHAQLRIYGNTTTIELAPVLLAAQDLYGDTTAVVNGGIPDLFDAEAADVATNAETQALRQFVDHPDLRTILTVSEGRYRLVARRSAGIATVADLRGKRITTARNTSSAYYLHKLLGTAGLTTADVTIVPITPLSNMPAALANREVDAVTIWEPEIENAMAAIGADAIELQPQPLIYRELFGLHTTAAKLVDPAKRAEIVAFVRAVIRASERIRAQPEEVWPLVVQRTGFERALVERVWRHHGYPGTLVPDLLDVMVEEDPFVAEERGREPRSRAELAIMIDASILREALAESAVAVSSPLVIDKQGALAVGGRVVGDPAASSLHCDHGVVEYQIPPRPRAVNLLMWHSASAAAWQNRWDGGEGFQSIFVRRGFPVYLWDGPRVGRANWGCAETAFAPETGRDQANFAAWRFGTAYPQWFDGVQFPKDDPEAWNQAMRARYQEFDTVANAQLESDAAAELADRIGPTVALTNSAGGLRALLTALKSDNIKGIVAYENVGYVFPQGESPGEPEGPFGPIEVPLEEFRKLTRIPMQMVWGDNVEKSDRYRPTLAQSRRFVDLVNRYGGKAEVLLLPEAGLTGNTHLPFADLNNVAVADLLSQFLAAHGLDARAP